MQLSFSNKNLREIHVTAEQSISSHLAKLDEVSNDIKALEAVLCKSGISVTFLYLFEEIEEDRNKYVDYDTVRIPVRVKVKHYVVWDRDKQRLLHEIYEIENEKVAPSEKSYRSWGPRLRQSRPLIETKTHIRLKVLPELEFFYNEMIKLLGQGCVEERIEVLSPNLVPF